MDEDLVRTMIDAKTPAQLDEEPEATAPPLREWDMTASMLATLIEEVRQTNLLIIASNAKKGTSLPKLRNVLRPVSVYSKVLSKARTDLRLRKHDALVARLLGDRAKKTGDG